MVWSSPKGKGAVMPLYPLCLCPWLHLQLISLTFLAQAIATQDITLEVPPSDPSMSGRIDVVNLYGT